MAELKSNVTKSGTRYQDELPIGDITIGRRFRKDLGDLRPLEASIRDVGLLHPVVVDDSNNLIAGLRRLEACRRLGWTKVPVRRVNLTEILKGQFHENAVRKDFTVSEIVAVKRMLEPTVREKAVKRQGRPGLPRSAESAEHGETRDIVADYAGVSHDTLAKAERLVEAAEKDPARFGPTLERVDSGQISPNYALSMIRRAESASPAPVPPEGEYDVIYANLPWPDESRLRGDAVHDRTMRIEDMARLKPPASSDAVLFLWATNPKLTDALSLMEAWGFRYRTNMVWVKDKTETGRYFCNMHELLLVGSRGDMRAPPEHTRAPSVLSATRYGQSGKPEEVYGLIEAMYPGRRYLEMFANGNGRKAWASWGEANGDGGGERGDAPLKVETDEGSRHP